MSRNKLPKLKKDIGIVTALAVMVFATFMIASVSLYSKKSSAQSGDVVVAAVGDICKPNSNPCKQTSDLIMSWGNVADVMAMGDTAYESGTISEFNSNYAPTWGRIRNITHPAPGNHEYNSGGAGYYQYFYGGTKTMWYSYDVGSWHILSLNSQESTAVNSAQWTWMKNDLAAHAKSQCMMAFAHYPRYSVGDTHGSQSNMIPLWQLAQDGGVDIMLGGHDHNYQRFAPQDNASGASATGMREWVVGTGGADNFYSANKTLPNVEKRIANNFGVLKLTLRNGSYTGDFINVGGTNMDSVSDTCRNGGTGGGTTTPTPVVTPTPTPVRTPTPTPSNTNSPTPTPTGQPTPTPAPNQKDLSVTNTTWSPTSPTAGATVKFSAVVKNSGTAALVSGTKFRVGFKVDSQLVNWADVTLSTSLAAGASATYAATGGSLGNANWIVTANPSVHTILATVDDTNLIAESNENNNTFTNQLTVGNVACNNTADLTKATVTQTITAGSTGTYRVWSRLKATSATSDSYWLVIDGTCPINVGDSGVSTSAWTWVNWKDGNANTLIDVSLSAGVHTVKLVAREADIMIDRVILTPDTACVPHDNGNDCVAIVNAPAAPVVAIKGGANLTPGVQTITTRAPALTITNKEATAAYNVLVNGIAALLTNGTDFTFTDKNGDYTITATASRDGLTSQNDYTIKLRNANINRTGCVDLFDMLLVVKNWGTANTETDLNTDNKVDLFDLLQLKNTWGGQCV